MPVHKEEKQDKEGVKLLAAVLLRGLIHTRHDIRKTLYELRLRQRHVCAVLPDTPTHRGMLTQCKDYITWGEVDEGTLKTLSKRKAKKDRLYHLNSPKGGYERKGIKTGFNEGGALGYRKNKINDLLQRMI